MTLVKDPLQTEVETHAPAEAAARGPFPNVFLQRVLAPCSAAVLVAVGAAPQDTSFEAGLVAFLCCFFTALISEREGRWTSLLPFMAVVARVFGPLLGAAAVGLVAVQTELPGIHLPWLAAAFVSAAAISMGAGILSHRLWAEQERVRVAVIGSQTAATQLARELQLARVSKYVVVGRIGVTEDPDAAASEVPTLGVLDDLADLVARHRLHLLVMTGEVPRLTVFNEVAHSCLHLPVRLWQLSGFYEETFGHVPVAEINASWFQYIMHPRYRSSPPASKRVIDVTIAAIVGAVSAPLLLVLAVLIRRDGGPALFRQIRIGEGGRPFTLYKLRTMAVGTGRNAQWASLDDPRVTRIGRFLRRSHLDEFPQVINVLRGEMSLVGPRPEQPEFVERLEQWVPYYTRRHLLTPGITGWAQVRCGYAGSDVGSAWKLCHDLYYLKHRSLVFDLVILGETVRTLFVDRQYTVEPTSVSFILGSERIPGEPAAVAATGQ